MTEKTTIGFIGAGNMASALIAGLLDAGRVPAAAIRASDPDAKRRTFVKESFGIAVFDDNRTVVSGSETIVLAVKPQQMQELLSQISTDCENKLCISIAAGISTTFLQARLPASTRVIRAMPNTPALVGVGATAIAVGKHAQAADIDAARSLFESVGICVSVDENQIDAVTGLSGSGPAYVFTMIEAMSEAGQRAGLPAETALKLSAQTVLGAAQLLSERGEKPDVLRAQVTSPGGTTVAGLQALQKAGFSEAIDAAVTAATKRSAELAAVAEKSVP